MRRLTIWITATLALVALVIAYQLNATGVGAKGGDDGDHGGSPPQQACVTAPASASGTATASCPPEAPAPAGSAGSSTSPSGDGSSSSGKGDDRGTNDQDGKPGENK